MKPVFLLVGLLLVSAPSQSQTVRYESDIQKFEAQDRQVPPPARPILLVGSSSFTYWTDVQAAFPKKQAILNRAFGGSTLVDLLTHYDRLIPKYRPRQVVIYCGENDLATAKSTVDEVYQRFVRLFEQIRRDVPKASIVYVSMKPSPSRWNLREEYRRGNELIRGYLSKQRKTRFVDVWPVMIDPATQRPIPAIFKADSLHMNEQGYVLWTKVLQPALKK